MNVQLKQYFAASMVFLAAISFPCLAIGQAEDSAPLEKNGLEVVVSAPAEVSPGATFDLNLKLSIPDGFHIYGSKDKTMPTELMLDELEGIEFSTPEIPAGSRHSKAGATNYWLEGKQTVSTKVSVGDEHAKEMKISGSLKFMICTDQMCKPPAKLPFEVVVAIKADKELESKSESSGFSAPVRLKANGEFISTEEPGYASPCLADIDGDGNKDLLVGQFNMGKIKVYKGAGDGKFSKGKWLRAGGKVAEVPGVW